ncbi:MAG: hypothetical protein GWP62_06910 [Gammaproteobacteria bacterium]|jgi:uncharacterized metal-binding protein YceD (DUF177 family)|nr:hypothetical protein [Gammaproteobacteria bacterium]
MTASKFTRFGAEGRNFWPPSFDLSSDGPYHARAMGNPLRERRSAADLAAGAQVIEIAEKIGDFEQLSAIVETDLVALDADRIPTGWRESAVEGSLEFGFADAQQSLPKVSCRVGVTVDAVCQRCIEPFRLPLEVEAELLLLGHDQDVDGFDELEVWELEETLLRPRDIVEELLIMALPFSAMHVNSTSCKALSPETNESAEKMTTPFAALRDQMAQDN